MITRFNAEYKKRLNGKGKFTRKERLVHDGDSLRDCGERFDISRTYYHGLGKKADCVLENLCASEQATERVIVLNKAFRERLIVSLTCRGMSAANITAFAEEMFGYSISGGTIWNTLKKVACPKYSEHFPKMENWFFKLFFTVMGKFWRNPSKI